MARANTFSEKRFGILLIIGLLILATYLYAWRLADLRAHTEQFLIVYGIAFLLYAGATAIVLGGGDFSRRQWAILFALTVVMAAVLCATRPTLSDDMYRYVWDGRVQAHGISPYHFPPAAEEVAYLRDDEIWPHINRKSAVTIYPPAAQMAYLGLWRIFPDSVTWFQAAMAGAALLAGGLLMGLLRDLGKPTSRVLIYLWSPLLLYETAHGAHVDALILPLLVGAWWARVHSRDGWIGILLGVATAIKLFPAMLLLALWRPQDPQGRWRMPLAFGVTVALCYAPYFYTSGLGVIGFLPSYVGERFNMGLAAFLIPYFAWLGVDPNLGLLALLLATLSAIALYMVVRPSREGVQIEWPICHGQYAVARSIWLMGAFTLLTQNLFAWYMLWMLPLLALFVNPGIEFRGLRLPALDAWGGWWLFCGLIALSYSFFIAWRPVPLAIWSQFLPLYAILIGDVGRRIYAARVAAPRGHPRPEGTRRSSPRSCNGRTTPSSPRPAA